MTSTHLTDKFGISALVGSSNSVARGRICELRFARDRDTLLLATGKLRGHGVGLVSKTDLPQQFERIFRCRAGAFTLDVDRTHDEVLQDIHV